MSEDFLRLLKKHRQAGSGRGRPGAWQNSELASKLSDLGFRASESAVSKWFNEANGISRPNLLALLDLMLPEPGPGCGCAHADRQRILTSFDDVARSKRRTSEEPPPALPGDWPRQNPPPSPGPAALELFTPVPDNQGGYRLTGRLDLTAREDESTDQPIRIALREAFVTLEASENLVTDGSLIGKREAHDNLAPDGGAVKVVGPKAKDSSLQGEVFDGRHIATVAPTDEAEGKVTVRVAAGRRGFIVTALDEAGAPIEGPGKEARDAVLNALFFDNLPRDEAGRAILQKAVLTRPARGTAKE